MAYNYFPTGYQPAQIYYPQNNQQMPQQTNSFQNGTSSIIWVQGEAGAKSYLVAPNQTVQLWDSESQTIYLKSADASGMPSIKVLDYKIRESAPQTPNIAVETEYATKADVVNLRDEINALKAKFDVEKEDE